jgi:hypothetical protein
VHFSEAGQGQEPRPPPSTSARNHQPKEPVTNEKNEPPLFSAITALSASELRRAAAQYPNVFAHPVSRSAAAWAISISTSFWSFGPRSRTACTRASITLSMASSGGVLAKTAPQEPQNLFAAGLFKPHFGHTVGVWSSRSCIRLARPAVVRSEPTTALFERLNDRHASGIVR